MLCINAGDWRQASPERRRTIMYIGIGVGTLILIILLVLSFNFVGDGLRDAFEVRLRKR